MMLRNALPSLKEGFKKKKKKGIRDFSERLSSQSIKYCRVTISDLMYTSYYSSTAKNRRLWVSYERSNDIRRFRTKVESDGPTTDNDIQAPNLGLCMY